MQSGRKYFLDYWSSWKRFHEAALQDCKNIVLEIKTRLDSFAESFVSSLLGQIRHDKIGEDMLKLNQASVVNLKLAGLVDSEAIRNYFIKKQHKRVAEGEPGSHDESANSRERVGKGGQPGEQLLTVVNTDGDDIVGKQAVGTGVAGPDSLERLEFKMSDVKFFQQIIVGSKGKISPSNSLIKADRGVGRMSEKIADPLSQVAHFSSMRFGIMDGLTIMKSLRSQFADQLTTMIASANTNLATLAEGLKEYHKDAGSVYRDADLFTAKLNGDKAQVSDFQSALDHLRSVESMKHHESLPQRTKYISIVMKELHAHIIALVAGLGKGESLGATTVSPATIKSSILSYTAGSSPTDISLVTPKDPNHVVRSNSEIPHADEIDKAKITAQCILYGRVDGAQTFAENKIEDLCTEPRNFGMSVINKLMDDATQNAAP